MSRARAERRREQRLQQKVDQQAQQVLTKICSSEKGTQFAIDRAYQQGYNQARKDLATFTTKQFLSATALAAHRHMRFGTFRCSRLLGWIREILLEEMADGKLIEKCKQETGIDITVQ